MKPYYYKEILEKYQFNSELKRKNYEFFNYLEDAVYEGLSADEFREKYNLPSIKYERKTAIIEADGFEQIINEDVIIPYWEIHHYKSGFSAFETNAGGYFNKDDQELHFYFTFKRLIPDSFYTTLPDWDKEKKNRMPSGNNDIFRDENGGLVIGLYNNKIDKKFGISGQFQLGKAIQVHVLDDVEDNFNVLSDIMPGGMLDLLSYQSIEDFKVSDFRPSHLPQMLFITGENHYFATTENVNSIVCLESSVSRTRFDENDTDIVKLKGNLFVKHDCPLTVKEIGKNTVLGEGTRVHSTTIIGDNVATGYRSLLYSDCKIGDHSIICDKVQIHRGQEIPAFQVITTKPVSFLSKAGSFVLSNFFYLAAKSS